MKPEPKQLEIWEVLSKVRECMEVLTAKAAAVVLRSSYIPRAPVYAPADEFSMTRQEFKDECDINVLMERYDKVGVWPLPPVGVEPEYLDVSGVPDLAGALSALEAATEAFMRLPASVRREFDNDAVRFVEFAQDPSSLDQMRAWGLAPPAAPGPAAASPSASPPAVSGGGSPGAVPIGSTHVST